MNYNPYNQYFGVQQQQQRYGIQKVNGRSNAEMFPLLPNDSVLLLDVSAPVVHLVQTDSMGARTVNSYQIKEIEEPKPITSENLTKTLEEFQNRMINFVDERLKMYESNSNKVGAEPSETAETKSRAANASKH